MGSRKGVISTAVVASLVTGSVAFTEQANAFGWGSIGDFFKDPVGSVGSAVSQVANVVHHVTSPVTHVAITALKEGANVVNQATNAVGVDSSAITDQAIAVAQSLTSINQLGTYFIEEQRKLAQLEHFAGTVVGSAHHLSQLESLLDGINSNNVGLAKEVVYTLIRDVDYTNLKRVADDVKNRDNAQSLMFMVNKGNVGVGVAVDINELERIKHGHHTHRDQPIMSFFVQAVNPGTPDNAVKFAIGYHKSLPKEVSGNSFSIANTVKNLKVTLAFASQGTSNLLSYFDITALRNQHRMTAVGASSKSINMQVGGTARQVVFKQCQNGRLQVSNGNCNNVHEDLSLSAISGVSQTDQSTSVGGVSFVFKSFGAVSGMYCVQTVEPADPHTWHDNYFCASQDIGMKWSYAGPIDGMRCTQIQESADPYTWEDNYLCLPQNSDFLFSWSSAGKANMKKTVRWHESADPHTWHDNYLGIEKHVELKIHGKCLDIWLAHPANGQDVVVHDCHGGSNQKWLFTNEGKVRSKMNYNKCLDYRNFATSNGERLMVWDCNTSPTQAFTYANSQLKTVLAPSRCVDAPSAQNGTRTHLWDCPVLHPNNTVVVSQ
ncbi:RICIN domain-containing protein [Pseudoalteromonas sp. SMS1]|uniref:RICIN domain-containing protein n=1 Tax=Pseudoalteromonas sp. SMS1 TaxID=2908894 RepID=UPI001F40B4B3|nr:RICIN domain-containing protein [Pseudoalteromonas sp. SMS1]MCF2858380.1 RICIN domain-containing protein [Pseudoalteromonas sp. SMS1]